MQLIKQNKNVGKNLNLNNMGTTKKSVKFGDEEKAKSFAAKVNGQFNDLRNQKGSRSKFSVTYTPKISKKGGLYQEEWAFGYPNDYWQ